MHGKKKSKKITHYLKGILSSTTNNEINMQEDLKLREL